MCIRDSIGAVAQNIVTTTAQNHTGALGSNFLDDIGLQNVHLVRQGHEMCIRDSYNDVAMLDLVGHPYIMSTAAAELRRLRNWIC